MQKPAAPARVKRPSYPQILGFQCGCVSVPELLGYHVQTSSIVLPNHPLGFVKKVLDVQFVVTYLLLSLLLKSCPFLNVQNQRK